MLFLKEQGVIHVVIPSSFQYAIGKLLEKEFKVVSCKPPFYPGRVIKTDWEIVQIEKAQYAVERAVVKAMEFLADCTISGGKIYSKDCVVTSEMLRQVIDKDLYGQGYLGIRSIVASGIQGADPHCEGFGDLQPYSPIVLDVFPLSMETHYWADQTRTVFKGNPSAQLKEMYTVVLRAQIKAIGMVSAGVDGYEIWDNVQKYFESMKYPTDTSKRPMEGFFHGVGHGVGIDLHEPPSIGLNHDTLAEGNIVTVEPGLYYSHAHGHIPAGGIRIEDLVVVEKDGCRNLTRFHKDLESMIIP